MINYIEKFKAGECVVEVPRECFGEFLYLAEKHFGYDFNIARDDWEWIKNYDKCMEILLNGRPTAFVKFNTPEELLNCAISEKVRNGVGCQYKEFKKEIERLEKFEIDDIFDIETYSYLKMELDCPSAYYLSWDSRVHWSNEFSYMNYSCENYGAVYKTVDDAKLARKWLRYVNTLLYFKRKYDAKEGEAHWVVEHVQHCYDGDRLFEILFCDFERSHEISPVYFVSREAAVKCARYLNEKFKEW